MTSRFLTSFNKAGRSIAMLSLVAAGGFYAGYRYSVPAGASIDHIAGSGSAALESEHARLLAENRRLLEARDQRSNSPATVGRESAAFTPLERLNVLLDLTDRQRANIHIPAVNNDGSLSDGFVHLFALTPVEEETLRRAVREAQREMDQALIAQAKVTRTEEALSVEIEPFYEGADVYDRLLDAFERTLGPDRYVAFNRLQAGDLPRRFSQFGAEFRTITITRTPEVEGRFRIEDRRRGPTGAGMSNISVEFSDTSELSPAHRWLAPLLSQLTDLPANPGGQ